jgi:hypothetical protein
MLIYISRITNNIKFYIIDIIIQPEFRLLKNFTPDRKCNITREVLRSLISGKLFLIFENPNFTISIMIWVIWGSFYSIFRFMCMFCRSLFVLLYFFFWPSCCLLFFDIWILITPLVYSNSSYRVSEWVSELYQTKTDVLLITTWLQLGHVYTV